MTGRISFSACVIPQLVAIAALASAVAVFWLVELRAGDPFDALVAAFAVFVLVLGGLWLTREGLHEMLDHRAMSAIGRGRPAEGDWVAVAGTAVPLGDETRAVLSDRPALACRYELLERAPFTRASGGTRSTMLKLRYEGWRVAPVGIKTATGTVRLRALPDLVNLERTDFGAAREGVLGSAEARSWFPPRYAARASLASLDRDRFDIDWRYGAIDPQGEIIRREWVLAPGEEVVVFGRWAGGSLAASPFRPRGLPVHAGSPGEVARRLGGGTKVFLALAAAAFLGAAWIVYDFVA
jgi:hypothetical protein